MAARLGAVRSCLRVGLGSALWQAHCSTGYSSPADHPEGLLPLPRARQLSLGDAQKMNVHCFQKAFSSKEIEEIFAFEQNNQHLLGSARRDAGGIRRVDGPWSTTYLHTGGMFNKEKCHVLDKIIALAIEADKAGNWNLLETRPNNFRVRVIECHTISKGGALQDRHHCDRGSLVTIDLMCADSSEYTGGRFMTLEAGDVLVPHSFEFGDVMVFPSHKYHCIEPVKSGTRRVFVVELWEGADKTCAHRCEDPSALCTYSKAHNNIDMIVRSPFPEIDPW